MLLLNSTSRISSSFIVVSVGILIFACLTMAPRTAVAATLTVINSNASGAGSLKQAISDAMSGDTIDFDLTSCPCTIANPSVQFGLAPFILIDKSLEIRGPGAGLLTVSGNDRSPVFRVVTGVTVAISGMTISHGRWGTSFATGAGGIINQGSLTLSESIVKDNEGDRFGGGAIYNNGGSMVINNTTITGNSGIYSSGGTVANAGYLTIVGSTIAGNFGPGIHNLIAGSVFAELTVISSTITGNTPGGGIRAGGIETLNNNIVAGNHSYNANGIIVSSDISSGIEIANSNVIGDAASAGGIINGLDGNIVGVNGTGTIVLDSLINTTLGNNGGPTPTHGLVCGSLAIDAGNNDLIGGMTTDQRGVGFDRIRQGVSSPSVDIGAFELQQPCNTAPTISVLDISQQQGSPNTRLQIASVDDVESAEDGLTITVEGGAAETINGVRVSNVEVSPEGVVLADILVSCSANNASFAIRVIDGGGLYADTVLNVTVIESAPPVITLNPQSVIFANDGRYRTFAVGQMVQTVTGGCETGIVTIEKVTSDEVENLSGNSDGNTINDVVIASDCGSVRLRGERDSRKNGRVYVVTLIVDDSSGHIRRANYHVNVPINRNSGPAVQDSNAYTVDGTCL